MTIDAPKTTLEGERRFATVVFADVSGFTAMSQKTDPEKVAVIMNRCFELLEEAVISHGGHVDKYIGDCIMALFGVPKALEHAPAYAVHAALEMRRCLAAFNREQKLSVPLGLHAGINSGLVLAGEVGGAKTRDFTVMGDVVNLASRLKDASPEGEIWVGTETYRYTRNDFEYEALRPLNLKGREGPTSVYSVTGAKVRPSRVVQTAPAEGMVFSSLVGRERELRLLEDRVAKASEGEGGIVSVLGEAGMGKSRLLGEMAELEVARGVQRLKGASLAVGRILPFHPFVDIFRQWAGIADGETDQGALATLERAVGRVVAADAGEIVPFVATLMGLRLTGAHEARLRGIEGEALEKLIHKAVRDLLQEIARERALVIVLEDLHWVDSSSLALLESLLRLVQEAGVLFVLTLRPEQSSPAQRVLKLAQKRYADRCLEISLAPLSAKQCDTLACNLLKLDDLSYTTLGRLLRRAEGNPFFIEEVVRSLIDEGAVEYRGGQFRVTDKIDRVVLPGTIQEVIMSRIDRLPEKVRRVVQIASVIGRSFRWRILAAVIPQDRDLEWALGFLKKRQVIVQRRAQGEVEYVFKHALGQEAIYESILQDTRKELHAAVARSIETIFADRLPEFYGMLAYHFSRAEHLEQAESYLFKAGDEAARAAASSEALSYFQEASRHYLLIYGDGGDPAHKALLEKNIGIALLNKGSHMECIPHFNQALAYLGESVPGSATRLALQCAIDLLAVLRYLYFTPRTRRPARDAHIREVMEIRYNRAKAQTTTDTTRFFFDTIASIRRLNRTDPATVDGACGMYAGAAALFGFSGVSFTIGARFLGIAGRLVREDNVRDLVAYRAMKFVHHYLAGDWSDVYAIDPHLLDQGLGHGLLWDVATYLGLSAERALRQGDFATAGAKIDKVAEMVDVYGSDFARSHRDGYRAALLLEQRRLGEALEAVQQYHAGHSEKLFNLLAKGWEAKIRILRGEREAASAALADAEKILAGRAQVPPYHRSPYLVSRLLFDVCDLEAATGAGNRSEIRACAKRARRSLRAALGNAGHVAIERTETYKLVGRLYWSVGEEKKAFRWWQRSLGEGDRLGARPELARTHLEVGRRLVGSETLRGLDAALHLERARALFTELDLAWDLEQLEAIEQARGADVHQGSDRHSAMTLACA